MHLNLENNHEKVLKYASMSTKTSKNLRKRMRPSDIISL